VKISITIILLLILSSSAWGYSKKIIFSSFTAKNSAEKSLSKFLKSSKSTQLNSLAEKNNFDVHIRQSGKYYIIVAEPINDKNLLSKALKIVKKSYKQAYANNYTPPEIVIEEVPIEKVVEKTQELNVSEEKVEVAVEEKEEVKESQTVDVNITKEESVEEILKSTKPVKKEIETLYKEEKFDFVLIFKWLLLFTVLSIMIFYFIKFKRIYDEY
jgi:hypothetical protein